MGVVAKWNWSHAQQIAGFMLAKQAIEQFKILFAEKFGQKLSDDEASFRANNIFELYRVVYGQSEIQINHQNKNEDNLPA